MRLMKWIFIMIMLFNCIFLLSKRSSLIVQAEDRNDHYFESNYIFDTTPFLNNTILLSDEAIYTVNSKGATINKINYPSNLLDILNSDKIKESLDESDSELETSILDIKIEVIEDIDHDGYSDLMIVSSSDNEKSFNRVVIISYKKGSVIWDYVPSMESTQLCNFRSYCKEPVSIMEYKIKDQYLLLLGGYELKKLDLYTGKTLKSFTYSNNVWDFEMISDINSDGINDYAIAVQPSKIIYLNGKTFKKISELDVATDLVLSPSVSIKRSVQDIAYIESRNMLLAAGEDGYVYEIDIDTLSIVSKNVIFPTDLALSYYTNKKTRNTIDLEMYKDDDQEFLLSGINSPISVRLNIVDSSDQDQKKDYIVNYDLRLNNTNTDDTTNHIVIYYSDKDTETTKIDHLRLHYIDKHIIAYTKEGKFNVFNLNQKKLIDHSVKIDSSLMIYTSHNGVLIMGQDQTLRKYRLDRLSGIDVEWSIKPTSIRRMGTLKSNDNLVTFKRRTYANQTTDYFTLYTKNHDIIKAYESSLNTLIIQKYLSDDCLYIVEYKAKVLYIKAFQLTSGKLLYERSLNLNDEIRYNNELYDELNSIRVLRYHDITSDQIDELFIVGSSNQQTSSSTTFLVYDFVTGTIINQHNLSSNNQHDYFLHKDVNQDGIPELLTYEFTESNHIHVELYLTAKDDLFNDTNKLQSDIQIPEGSYEVVDVTDINNDGYNELIMNFKEDKYSIKDAIYLLNYSEQSITQVSNLASDDILYEDMNGDGIKEILILERSDSSYFNIYINNYNAGIISNTHTVSIKGQYLNDASNLYAVYDYNQDGSKDLITATHKSNVTHIKVVDYKTNKVIAEHLLKSWFWDDDQKNVNFLDIDSFLSTQLIEFNDAIYMGISSSITNDILLLEPSTFELKYHIRNLSDNDNGFLIIDEGTFYMKNPIRYDTINPKLTGLYNNHYQLKFDDLGIKTIQVLIYDQSLNSTSIIHFTDHFVDLHLSNGSYHLIFKIVTEDGNQFIYQDEIHVKQKQSTSIRYYAILIIPISTLFMINRFKINKYLNK